MDYLKNLLKSACERCEEGNFDTCECHLSCPVFSLYCEAQKKQKVVYKRDCWQTPPTPRLEMI